jgi:hypothetical protein
VDQRPIIPENLPRLWSERAAQLKPYAPAAAQAFETAAVELEQALAAADSETLTLIEAARLSGLTRGHLGDLIRAGKLPNAGRKGKPLIRRADLPAFRKPEQKPRRSVGAAELTGIITRRRSQRR